MAERMQSAKLELKLKVLLKYIVVKTVAQHNSTLSSSHTTLDTGRQNAKIECPRKWELVSL